MPTKDQHQKAWIHRGDCNNAFHRDCLLGWVVHKKQKRREAGEDEKHNSDPDCPTCRQAFMERPLAPMHDAVDLGSAAVELEWIYLPKEIQDEVLHREEDSFDGWPLVIWTDRLRPK